MRQPSGRGWTRLATNWTSRRARARTGWMSSWNPLESTSGRWRATSSAKPGRSRTSPSSQPTTSSSGARTVLKLIAIASSWVKDRPISRPVRRQSATSPKRCMTSDSVSRSVTVPSQSSTSRARGEVVVRGRGDCVGAPVRSRGSVGEPGGPVSDDETPSGGLRRSPVPPAGAAPSSAAPAEVARVGLGTAAGEFEARAFECDSGFVYLALVKGELGDGRSVLARVHSECLTGDALGSLRCDCGVQLRTALRAIASEGRGVLVYATGHEGRGIGLVRKLQSYMLQDGGLDTLDANRHLGLPADARDYRDAAAWLAQLGVSSVRLLTNNPGKARGLRAAGIEVERVIPLPTSPHLRNVRYLLTKERRLGHASPAGNGLAAQHGEALDVTSILGAAVAPATRPYVALKYAQTLDGRIATRTGDSKWISSEAECTVSHALRGACDAVLVGVGTVVADDPQLTVRLVRGSSPLRVVLDSTLRLPALARVLDDEAATIVVTTDRSDPERRRALAARGIAVRVVAQGPGGVDLTAALADLRGTGIRSLLVEGGAQVITSFLRAGLVDRLIVAIAPTIVGSGTEAVGDLDCARVADGLRLTRRSVHPVGDDLLVAADVAATDAPNPS